LERENVKPSPEADRNTLLRRLSLDLTGLPPSPAEIQDFLSDTSPNAYEKVVDRLLASPHYGERWGRHWLDVARYADSNGYSIDGPRSIWKYRDWVIAALNRDLPFDQFTIEQLAGDLLPNATEEQKIATGFHRNTMINQEGGADPKEFFYYAIVDRANTTATVWLGATLGCAQCHNHKFDPFSQKDYYSLLAFFNSSAEEGKQVGGNEVEDISPKVTVEWPDAKDVRKQIAEVRPKLNEQTPELAALQAKWEQEASRKVAWTTLDFTDARSAAGTA